MKLAATYLYRGKFFVHSQARTVHGVWITAAPVIVLPAECTDSEVAQAIRTALLASRDGVEHPVDWKALGSPLLEAAGCSSWRKFISGTTSAGVEAENGDLYLVTFENRGAKYGFVEKERILLPEGAKTGDELGTRVREVLEEEA